eukprot:XP_001700268.1 predicted protein [Chlamydomonas reinhardtii]
MSAGADGRNVDMARIEGMFKDFKAELMETLKETTDCVKKVEASQQKLEASQQKLEASQQQLNVSVQRLEAQVAASSHNAYARVCNSRAGATEPLQPLVREKAPSQATDPALKHEAFKVLAAFYGNDFGGSNAILPVRCRCFGDFIGVTGLCLKPVWSLNQNTPNLKLQVLGAGFGRTGSLSLYVALNALGYKTHHMVESSAAYWSSPGLLGGYTAAVDWPAAGFLPELLAAHPDIKVVLTSRDFDAWYDSARRTIFEMSQASGRPLLELPLHMRLLLAVIAPPLAQLRKMMLMVEELVWGPRGTFRGHFTDKDFVFDEHYAEVRRLVPRQQLLEYDVRQGWGPLCDFMGRPVPMAAAGNGGAAAGKAGAAVKPPTVKMPGWRGHQVKGTAEKAERDQMLPDSSPASSSGSATDAGAGMGAAEFCERMEVVRRLVRSIKVVQRGVEVAAGVGLGALVVRIAAVLLARRARR